MPHRKHKNELLDSTKPHSNQIVNDREFERHDTSVSKQKKGGSGGGSGPINTQVSNQFSKQMSKQLSRQFSKLSVESGIYDKGINDPSRVQLSMQFLENKLFDKDKD
jgi:hypothetical protein